MSVIYTNCDGCRGSAGVYGCPSHAPGQSINRLPAPQGWVCPTCGRVMSPSMATCVQDHSAQPVPKTGANQ